MFHLLGVMKFLLCRALHISRSAQCSPNHAVRQTLSFRADIFRPWMRRDQSGRTRPWHLRGPDQMRVLMQPYCLISVWNLYPTAGAFLDLAR
jgi:hypothetical protein